MEQAQPDLNWQAPAEPADELKRLAALHALHFLDAASQPELDRITRLAARLFDVPIALVSLIDKERQWFLSRVGLGTSETARNISFCGHAILDDGPMVVEDALLDARFAGNPLVTGEPYLRFYAGQPIRSRQGHALGTLCLIDRQPRGMSAQDLLALRDFAVMVEQYFQASEVDAQVKSAQLRYTRSEALLNNTFAQAAVGMALLSFDGKWLQVNQRLCDMLGYQRAALLSTSFQEITHAEDLAGDLAQVAQLLAGQISTYTMEKRYLHANGSHVWAELTVSLLRDHAGHPLYFLSVINDIDARKHAQMALASLHGELESRVKIRTHELEMALAQLQLAKQEAEANAERFISAAESHLDAYSLLHSVRDDDGKIVDFRFEYVNQVAQAVLGLPREQIIGRRLCELLPPHVSAGMLDKFIRTVDSGEPLAEQFCLDLGHGPGQLRWIYHEVVKTGDGLSISSSDISERIRAEESLRLKEAMLRQVTDAIPALVAFVDAGQCYRYCNRAYYLSFAADAAQIVGSTMHDFLGEEQYQFVQEHIERAVQGICAEFDQSRLKDGKLRQFETHYLPQREAEGQVTGFYIVGWDVTEQRLREETLRDRATLDQMTGLLNRSAFMALLEDRLLRSPSSSDGVALLFLDIDHFKQVNDRYGHAAGDALIREFARRTRGAVRGADIVARLGGDEFVVLLPQVASLEAAALVTEKIRAAMRQPVTLHDSDGIDYRIASSIGVAYADAAAAPRFSAAEMLARADQALYQAKAAGRDCWRSQVLN
ncbi:diguanylate cyclase [Janthinobacterium agaricidamnosum]|uniref:Sensory box protein n=1 Tax=Janthinobacterium agaricidamnosum NBRC 102515 = DSM 9628 TaxID=1349767 RepID=W0V0H1_9BURK|nr:diguanylate cyclase [Janthinobacterium agaricidamnosum]CDG80833.1 sensory box protein [Janthinobacterium agaricidamnosum NBRC 102515 = DSM 9628]